MEFQYSTVGTILFVVALERLFSYQKALKAVNHHPGHRRAISASSVLSGMAPRIRGVFPGADRLLEEKMRDLEYYGWDAITDVSWFGRITTTYIISDAAAIKEIVQARTTFPKPIEHYAYKALAIYGGNIATTEGEIWRRHKKLLGPVFNESNNMFVWDEAIRVTAELFEEVWEGRKEIVVDHCLELTLPIALSVLGGAVFGMKMTWKEETLIPPGHQMSFKDALHHVSIDVVTKAAVPNWMLGLTARWRRTRLAYDELRLYMNEMIEERSKSQDREHRDLFSLLLASKQEGGGRSHQLTAEDILGNTFIFLTAGHETMSHTMCFTLALLALYQAEQKALFNEIASVLEGGRLPVYEDISSLPRALAVFHETLRLFPAVTGIPKVATEDTILTIGNQRGESTTIPVPKGTNIIINTPALHNNPRYWNDTHEFKPDRFLDPDVPRDAFMAFSGGARSCLGRRFAETEAVAILAMIVSRYKITVKDELAFANETFEERKARVLACSVGLTIAPTRVPLVFSKRD